MVKKQRAVDRVREQLDKLLLQQTDKVHISTVSVYHNVVTYGHFSLILIIIAIIM